MNKSIEFFVVLIMNISIFISCNETKLDTFDFNSNLYRYRYEKLNNRTVDEFVKVIKQDSISFNYLNDVTNVYGISIFFKNSMIFLYFKKSTIIEDHRTFVYENIKNFKIDWIEVYNGRSPDNLLIRYRFI
jgi:hypothetical protein